MNAAANERACYVSPTLQLYCMIASVDVRIGRCLFFTYFCCNVLIFIFTFYFSEFNYPTVKNGNCSNYSGPPHCPPHCLVLFSDGLTGVAGRGEIGME